MLQDGSDSLLDPKPAMRVDETGIEGKRRKRRKRKVVYKQPFFERPEHILFRGNKMVVRTEDLPLDETTAQASESVSMEVDVASVSID